MAGQKARSAAFAPDVPAISIRSALPIWSGSPDHAATRRPG